MDHLAQCRVLLPPGVEGALSVQEKEVRQRTKENRPLREQQEQLKKQFYREQEEEEVCVWGPEGQRLSCDPPSPSLRCALCRLLSVGGEVRPERHCNENAQQYSKGRMAIRALTSGDALQRTEGVEGAWRAHGGRMEGA